MPQCSPRGKQRLSLEHLSALPGRGGWATRSAPQWLLWGQRRADVSPGLGDAQRALC